MNRDIWAKSKSNILLKDHTSEMTNQTKKLKSILNLDINMYRLLKLGVLMHDLGKVSPFFQIEVGNYNYFPKVPFPDIPHSLFSLFWINTERLKEELGLNDTDISILFSAITFHHWRDRFSKIMLGLESSIRDAANILFDNVRLRDELRRNLRRNLRKLLKKLSIREDIIDFNEVFVNSIRNGNPILNLIFPPYLIYFLPYRAEKDVNFKRKNIYVSGFLMRVDHFTSYIQEEDINENIEKEFVPYKDAKKSIKSHLKNKLGKELSDDEIWQISEIEKLYKNKTRLNVVLVSPTGSGKTEFAYLWGSGRKIIFTLPLRSAVNSIFLRASRIFGEENVGLLHSDADIYISELSRRSYSDLNVYTSKMEGKPIEDSLRVLELSKQLSLPVLVSTGDQIFPSALKYPGYEKIYATLGYSNLIIDEVQAYDPRASAIIVKLIEDIVNLGGNFLLMTATLPKFVRKEIEERIGENAFVYLDRYENLANIVKHNVKLRNVDIGEDSVLDEVISKAKENNRILVIANTVKKSQEIFEKLRIKLSEYEDRNILLRLLHSRFTLEDRKNKERELIYEEFKNPKEDEGYGKILVATQVVEASLDIDADYLYTEIAPIDALIQRMGRVLRRVKNDKQYLYEGEPNVVVFFNISDDKGMESSKGLVYSTELLDFTLLILLKRAGIIDEKYISELRNIYSINSQEPNTKKKRRSHSQARKDFFDPINQEINDKNLIFKLDEKEKKLLVEELYDTIPETCKYIRSFYDTLAILDSGYVSEKKSEALDIFREIYTIPAIPLGLKDEFLNTLKSYIENGGPINYASFKEKILAKFCVNIDIRRYLRGDNLSLERATSLIGDITFKVPDGRLEKVIRWLSDIYTVENGYDSELGLRES